MRLVLIEDKKIAMDGMLLVLRKNPMVEVVGTAMDGKKGLSLIKETEPEVVMTDIKMPEMNGLEMIEKVKADLPDTVFIVFSGYNEFRYVQKAIGLGVVDYLEKPVTVTKLMNVLKNAQELLDYRKNYQKMAQRTQRAKRVLVDQALHRLTSQPSGMEEENMHLLLEADEELQLSAEFFVAFVSPLEWVPQSTDAYRRLIDAFSFGMIQGHSIDVYTLTEEGYFLFFYFNRECNFYDFSQASHRVYEKLLEEEQTACRVGISNVHQNIYDLRIACLEAKKAGKYAVYLEKDSVVHCSEVEYARHIPAELYEIQADIEYHLRLDDYEVCNALIESYIKSLAKLELEPERIRQECLELLYLLQRISSEDGRRDFYEIIGIPSMEIFEMRTIDQIIFWTKNTGTKLIELVAKSRSQSKDPIAMVKKYIQNHYAEGITLNTLAELTGLSANYLSMTFSRREGVSYSRYLTQVRMKHAMQLLRKGEKVKDVYTQVGYYDYKHFVSQFKKYSGMTPDSYKNTPADMIDMLSDYN